VQGGYELTATAGSIVSEGIGTPGLDSHSAVGRYAAGASLRSTFGSVKPYRMETKAMERRTQPGGQSEWSTAMTCADLALA
jgi:hypothetical protein